MNSHLQDLMRDAARLTQSGRLHDATALLQRAVGGLPASAHGGAPRASTPFATEPPSAFAGALDALRRLAPKHMAGASPAPGAASAQPGSDVADVWDLEPGPAAPAGDAPGAGLGTPPPGQGAFLSGSHTHASLTRRYKLFVPPQASGPAPLPLVLMLHGCKQDPDDFAAGTDMNHLALEQGFLVLYPAQAQDANPSGCWNWFKHNHQERDRGEPAVIASMAQAVMREWNIDPRRVYIAGLSAGAAMAAIVGSAYPDIFAAVGVHSGLAPGVAKSLPEALMAMNGTGGAAHAGLAVGRFGASGAPSPAGRATLPQPLIVFHGDLDKTVHPRNGDQVVAAALAAVPAGPSAAVEQGVSAQGRRYTRSVHSDAAGQVAAEQWVVHGAGHAWSGGRAAGSYTDAQGPDASREMLRFFFAHPRRA